MPQSVVSVAILQNQHWNRERYRVGRQRSPMTSIRGERNTPVQEKVVGEREIIAKNNTVNQK